MILRREMENVGDICDFYENTFDQLITMVMLRLADPGVQEWLKQEGLERIHKNMDRGLDAWNNHGGPDLLMRDIMEELADATVYEAMRMNQDIHNNKMNYTPDGH